MPQISGTTDTYDTVGIREDLEDVIWDLFPGDTYLLTNLEKLSATSTYHEWQFDSLAAAAANRQLEGDDAAFTTLASPTRVGNYCQISRKTFIVSGTLEEVRKAGRASEIARAAMKSMRELKRDMENALVGNQASSAGGQTTARSCGGMESWIPTTDNGGNGVRATTSASASTAAYASGAVTAPTDGTTTGALTEAKFREALGLAWADGGDDNTVLVGTTQKVAVAAFSGVATKFNEIKTATQAMTIGAVDMYVSDYGNHKLILHRYIRSSVVLCLDPDYWAVAYLRKPFMEKLAKTGDAEKRQLISEYTLVSRNHNASSKVVACA